MENHLHGVEVRVRDVIMYLSKLTAGPRVYISAVALLLLCCVFQLVAYDAKLAQKRFIQDRRVLAATTCCTQPLWSIGSPEFIVQYARHAASEPQNLATAVSRATCPLIQLLKCFRMHSKR
jgi:hypothetical protein